MNHCVAQSRQQTRPTQNGAAQALGIFEQLSELGLGAEQAARREEGS